MVKKNSQTEVDRLLHKATVDALVSSGRLCSKGIHWELTFWVRGQNVGSLMFGSEADAMQFAVMLGLEVRTDE